MAETTFDFGKEQRLTLALSYMTELFGDLADLTLCMLRGEASGIAAFTDEYDHYKLSFQHQPDSLYFLHQERWHPWSLLPGVLRWSNDDEGCLPEVHVSNSLKQPAFVRRKALPGKTMYTLHKVRQKPFRTFSTSDFLYIDDAMPELPLKA
ncbi:hypothetical protein [Prosthecobacter sp.]|uniref:hypothetical protein n=1 Tax=Prosthecobacter sp. TaxID=1965333 RepID=UPI0037832E89